MQKNTIGITISGLGIGLNIVLATLAKALGIPFVFLDSIGTILSAVLLGPFFGGMTGLITNIIKALVNNPIELPYAIVNLAIGIFVGYVAKKFQFTPTVAILTGLSLAILAPLIGTPITVFLFGGLTGGSFDILTGWLIKSGEKVFTATFIPRVMSNIIDKTASCFIVSVILSKLPKNMLNKIRG